MPQTEAISTFTPSSLVSYAPQNQAATLIEAKHQSTEPDIIERAIQKGFRRGYVEDAAAAAEKIKQMSGAFAEGCLAIAALVWGQKERLNRKEFGIFVADILEWTAEIARKYLDIGKTFGDLENKDVLFGLEPFMLHRLCGKKYGVVVECLREIAKTTVKEVADLIRELVPKTPRAKSKKGELGDAVLQRHPNMDDGTFYYEVKNVILSDRAGLWLEEKLQTQTIGQVIEEFRDIAAQPTLSEVMRAEYQEELRSAVNEMRDAEGGSLRDHRHIELERELLERDQRIAELEKIATNPQQNSSAQTPDSEYAVLKSETQIEEEVESDDQTANDQSLSLSEVRQAFQIGDFVEINSDRQGSELLWEIGTVTATTVLGCAVKVAGKHCYFWMEELIPLRR